MNRVTLMSQATTVRRFFGPGRQVMRGSEYLGFPTRLIALRRDIFTSTLPCGHTPRPTSVTLHVEINLEVRPYGAYYVSSANFGNNWNEL